MRFHSASIRMILAFEGTLLPLWTGRAWSCWLRCGNCAPRKHGSRTEAGLEQDSFNAVWEKRNVEVHQQAGGDALKTQVGHKLSRMNRQEPFDSLDLDNQRVFNQEVNNITLLDPNSLVLDR